MYREYVGADRPARATVGARLTGPAYNVEVTFVASAASRQAIETECAAEPQFERGGQSGTIVVRVRPPGRR